MSSYTRAQWEAIADNLLRAAWKWATPSCALLDLPGRTSASGTRSDGLEGYARTFLAAAFRVAGGGGRDPHGWLDRYAEGLAAGTLTPGRDDIESWPVIGHYHLQGQPMVESASIALGLRLTRPWLWDRLDPDVRDRAEDWLRGALRHTPSPNNWYLFPFTVAGFLESVGRGDEETVHAQQRAIDLMETWYRGQGWYSDGDGRAFDYYNGWALHLYPMLHAYLSSDAELSTKYGARLREHLESSSLLFGSDGAPLYFGRSLTYRFAAGTAIAVGALTGHTPLTPGTSRRLLSGSLRYFIDRGAIGPNGLLSLGWHGPHEATVQFYSGPASPYWAAKCFVALLAPEDHPLWTSPEQPAPCETADRVLALGRRIALLDAMDPAVGFAALSRRYEQEVADSLVRANVEVTFPAGAPSGIMLVQGLGWRIVVAARYGDDGTIALRDAVDGAYRLGANGALSVTSLKPADEVAAQCRELRLEGQAVDAMKWTDTQHDGVLKRFLVSLFQ